MSRWPRKYYLLTQNARDDSPKRRKQIDFEGRRSSDRADKSLRYSNNLYRRDDYYGGDRSDGKYRHGMGDIYSRKDDFADKMMHSGHYGSENMMNQNGHFKYSNQEDFNRTPNQKSSRADLEPKIPCSSSSLKDPEAFARFLLLPTEVIQNCVLQLANNNKQALVGRFL